MHDAPMAMAFALIVLAVGSVGAGYINVPHAIGGSTELERFLEPNLGAGEHLSAATRIVAPAAQAEEASVGTERGLMALSSLVGVWPASGSRDSSSCRTSARPIGLRNGWRACGRCSRTSTTWTRSTTPSIVQPIRILSEHGLWKIVDCQADRRRGQRSGGDGRLVQLCPETAADRIGPRLCRLAVPRRRADARILPVAVMSFPILTSLVALPIVGSLLLLVLRDDRRERADDPRHRARGGGAGLCGDAAAVGALRPGVRRLPVRRAPRLDSRRSASATRSASTASACCWSC